MKKNTYRRSKRVKTSLLKRTLMFLGFLLVMTIGVMGHTFFYVKKNITKMYVNDDIRHEIKKADKPLSILLMGVDTGDDERGGEQAWNGNTDSQIVLTLNPQKQTTTIISIQRDTMANITNDKGKIISTQKINAAYPIGYNENGINTATSYAMRTIGQQIGIPLNNFVVMNMKGLVNLVNDVGGIDIINDSGRDIFISNTEPEYTQIVPFIGEGKAQHINGEQALVFCRDRDHLPDGDYGRAAHQREVFQELMKKILKINNIFTYQKFLKDISSDFKTNISVDIKNLMTLMKYRECLKKVVSIQYEGIGAMVKDSLGNMVSYQFIPEVTYLAIQNAMRKAINDSEIKNLNSSIITYESKFGNESKLYNLPYAIISENGKKSMVRIDSDGEGISINTINKQKYGLTNNSLAK
ncbi:LCP family protein [Lactococcus garvieae]|uniref:LCP family protein n=1 Tax=Lactococcus garvieae TaxID=1363 RepID=UPI003D780981